MKKISYGLLISCGLILTACTPKAPQEAFIPKQTVELEAVDEILPPVENTVLQETEVLETSPEESSEDAVDLADVAQEINQPLKELEAETYQKGERIDTALADQVSVLYFFDYASDRSLALEAVVRRLQREYEPSVLWIFRPVGFGVSRLAAKAAECAREQDQWALYHQGLLNLRGGITQKALMDLGDRYGLSESAFNACMDSTEKEALMQAFISQADSLGIEAAPSFVIGDNVVFSGNYPPALFEQLLRSFLDSRIP